MAARLTRRFARSRAGFTLIELVTVLVIAAVGLTYATLAFSGYFQRVNAERAAQLFAQDLALARTVAMRSRERVVIRFYEAGLWYEIEAQASGTKLATRRFGTNADIELSAIGLGMPGDSLVFDRRGFANLGGIPGPLGTATFASGAVTYTVSFNSMGASKLDRS
jgi:prepilin-type N-terminal cleavage/methylation domain-containing protein